MALTDNLVAYYKLDETSGTTAYDALGNYNGTNNGATVNQAGKIGKAYDFERSENDYVSLGNFMYNNLQNTPYTISAWFKIESNNNYQSIILNRGSSDRHTGIYVSDTNKIRITMYAGGSPNLDISGSTTINTGTWYNVVLIYNKGTGVSVYLNNNLEISQGTSSTYPIESGETSLGRKGNVALDCFDGLIDEVGIWNRTLNQSEITELYNSGTGLSYPFFTGYTLNFNVIGGSGTIEKDPDKEYYDEDEEVGITAIPTNEDYRFKEWSGDLVSTTNPETIIMNSNKEIDVYFGTRTITPGIINFSNTGDILVSKPVYMDTIQATKARLSITSTSEVSNFGLYLSTQTSESSWESVTNNQEHTFTQAGTQVRYKVTSLSPDKKITKLNLKIN